jgi:hypothetical protein
MVRKATGASRYDVHPGIKMIQTVITNMRAKTGRTFTEWVTLVKHSGPEQEKDRREWLKREHGIGTNYAFMIAERAAGRGQEDSDPEIYLKAAEGYVEAMYAGHRAKLKPIHDLLLRRARELGDDIKICPCKTMVPVYRLHVIAQIKPAASSRLELGLALKGARQRVTRRLQATGGLERKDRITHRIPLASVDQVDDEVWRWLRIAYELDA